MEIEIYNPGTFPDDLTPYDFISNNLSSYKRNRLILDILFRSKDVEKSGTGFQRVNELYLKQNVSWTFRKEAYGFFFEFIRTNVHINVQINVHLTEQEQRIINLIDSNDRITREELAVRISELLMTLMMGPLSRGESQKSQKIFHNGILNKPCYRVPGIWPNSYPWIGYHTLIGPPRTLLSKNVDHKINLCQHSHVAYSPDLYSARPVQDAAMV